MNYQLFRADNKKDFMGVKCHAGRLNREESDWLANAANAASLLYQMLPDINWAGFYLMKKENWF